MDIGILRRLEVVEGRMDSVETRVGEMHGFLSDLVHAVGKPAEGDRKATGLYGLIEALNGRLGWFERMRERAMGAAWAFAVGGPVLGIIVWFLAGNRISAVFGG